MKRTQARCDELPPGDDMRLADLRCRVCGQGDVAVICMGRDNRGAINLVWCDFPCAMTQGWPFLASERRTTTRARSNASPASAARAFAPLPHEVPVTELPS